MSPARDHSAEAAEHLLSPRTNSSDEEIIAEVAAQRPTKPRYYRRPWRGILEGAAYATAGVLVTLLFTSIASLWTVSTDSPTTWTIPESTVVDKGQTFRTWEPSAACGNTSEKAIEQGCIYDDVLLHWMPPACSSPELIDEFEHVWPWEFFRDQNATQLISLPEVREGTHDIKWVSMDLHRWHCVATWKILSSAARWGTTVPGYAVNWNHSVHCADHVLINMHTDDPFTINSHLDIEYTPCVTIAQDRSLPKLSRW